MLLDTLGISKAEFARMMGIQRQNIKALFKTRNIDTIQKVASVLGVPFGLLISYVEQPSIEESNLPASQLLKSNIPTGNNKEDILVRKNFIFAFYQEWRKNNPEQKLYNFSLNEYINIRAISVEETAVHASKTYLSTLAVLQLDAILTNAKLQGEVTAKSTSKKQRPFEKMLLMKYECIGIGEVKLTVGIKRSDKSKVQYCITAIQTKKAASLLRLP